MSKEHFQIDASWKKQKCPNAKSTVLILINYVNSWAKTTQVWQSISQSTNNFGAVQAKVFLAVSPDYNSVLCFKFGLRLESYEWPGFGQIWGCSSKFSSPTKYKEKPSDTIFYLNFTENVWFLRFFSRNSSSKPHFRNLKIEFSETEDYFAKRSILCARRIDGGLN